MRNQNIDEMSYSLDLRNKVLKYIEKGGSIRSASKIFIVTRYSIYKWKRLKKLKGSPIDSVPKRSFKKLDPEKLKACVEAHPNEMRKTYAKHFGVDPKAISKAFVRLKITRKKRALSTKKGVRKSGRYFWSQ